MKKTIEQLKKEGRVKFLNEKLTGKHGLTAPCAMLTEEYEKLEMPRRLKKRGKDIRALLVAVYWTINNAQIQGIPSDQMVRSKPDGWPTMVVGVYPFSAKNRRPVIMIGLEV